MFCINNRKKIRKLQVFFLYVMSNSKTANVIGALTLTEMLRVYR